MNIVLMRDSGDCEEAAGGTATGKTWEEMHRALGKKGIPNSLEDPLAGNPASFKRAIESLGFRCDEIGVEGLLSGRATAGRTIALVHNTESPVKALFQQHWVVYAGRTPDDRFLFYWGNLATPRVYSREKTVAMVMAGKLPQSVFEVIPVEKPAPWWKRILYWFGLKKKTP